MICFRKGLFYKEFKIGKWFLFLLTGELLFLLNLQFIEQIELLKDAAKGRDFHYENFDYTFRYLFNGFDTSKLLFIMSIIFLGSFLIGIDFSGKKYEFLTSLPYSREEIIKTKYIVGLLVIFISFTISFGVILTTFSNNIAILSYYLSYEFLFKYYFINLLIYIFIFLFIMLIQSLCGKNILGGVLGGIFLLLPLGLVTLIEQFLRILMFSNIRFYGYEEKDYLFMNLQKVAYYLSPTAYSDELSNYLSYSSRLIILVVLIIILVFALEYSFKKLPFERIGYISIYPLGEKVLKIGISFCTGLLAFDICSSSLTNIFNLYKIDKYLVSQYVNYTIFYSALCFIGVGIITYFITNKVIELSKD